MLFAPRIAAPASRRWNRGCFALGVSLLLLSLLATTARAARSEVLILISRNPADVWAVAELDGMQKALRAASPAVAAAVEFMDTPQTPPPEFDRELRDYLASKYAAHGFRVILAADKPALDFVIRHRADLWPAAQAVFCGIAHADLPPGSTRAWLTGVVENTDPAATLRLALRLQPGLRRLVIIDDSSQSGRGNLLRLQRDLPDLEGHVKLELLRADTVRALFRGVENLPPDSAVLLTRAQVARRMGPELLHRCPVPVYGQRSPTHLGAILGGAMIDGERHGAAAAALGLKLLAGTSASALPIITDLPPRVVVEYAQMQRFGLPLSVLPPGAEVHNRPRRVWEVFPSATIATIVTVLSLGGCAAGLAVALIGHRRHARAMKNSLSLLNATLDASADGVLVVDLAGRVSGFNRRFTELWKIPPELAAARDDQRMLGSVLSQLKDPEGFARRVEEIYATGDDESYDTIEFLDGRVFERRGAPQRLEGRTVGRVWTFADITARRAAAEEHRRLEARLAHTHRLEALGTLAGGIAHDFNNLLTAILGYTNLAHDSLPAGDPIRADLQAVLGASERARDLVRQILTFSRKGPSERRVVRCADVVAEAVRLLRATVPASVLIEFQSAACAAHVEADPSQIHQVVLNLGTNAAHALRDRAGAVTIALEEVAITPALRADQPALTGERCLCLSICDDGEGMNPETLRRAFDPFFTTKAPGDGTGLGLAVVHGIMESHRGAVTLESQPGVGTTVRLYFPLGPASAAAAPASRLEAPRLPAGMRVLIVDDESAVLGVGEQWLDRAGLCVTACCSAMAALSRLRSDPGGFDLLLTDLNMPQMNGTELAAEARQVRPDLAIVLATGFLGDEAVEQRVAALEIDEVVLKPYRAEELLAAFERALERRRTRRAVAISA